MFLVRYKGHWINMVIAASIYTYSHTPFFTLKKLQDPLATAVSQFQPPIQLTFLSRKNRGSSKPRKQSKSKASAKTLPAIKPVPAMATNLSAEASKEKPFFKLTRKILEKLRAFFHLERKTIQEPVRITTPSDFAINRYRRPMMFETTIMKGDPCLKMRRMRKQIIELDILETSSIIPLDIIVLNEKLEEDYKAKYGRLYTRPTKLNWTPMSSATTMDNSQGTKIPQTSADISFQVGNLMDSQPWKLKYASSADDSYLE